MKRITLMAVMAMFAFALITPSLSAQNTTPKATPKVEKTAVKKESKDDKKPCCKDPKKGCKGDKDGKGVKKDCCKGGKTGCCKEAKK